MRLGPDGRVRLTGPRNPCWQIDDFKPGLLKVAVAPGDAVYVELPAEPHQPLERV